MTADTTMVCVGPVDAAVARVWVRHELRNLARLRPNIAVLPFAVPDDVLDEIEGYLRQWRFVADALPEFRWCTLISRGRLAHLVRYWANLDLLTDDLVSRLGLEWAPVSTRPFFDAVVAGVDEALCDDPFARVLAR